MNTIYSAITPLMSSAVIVVRISGADARKVLNLTDIRGLIDNIKPRNVYNCRYEGGVIDDILLTYFKAPSSYTGEDVVELSFHGNPLIASTAFADFEKLGFVSAEPGEFTKRAFLNGRIDLTQAEAVAELIASKTVRGIDYSYQQLKGSLRKEIEDIKNIFISILTIVEAHIDFPEEDIEEAHAEMVFDYLKTLLLKLKEITGTYRSHKVMRDGFRIAIVGKPNTGKSSLMNLLLREERAIVSEKAGTTRDYIEAGFLLNGIPVSLVDTAGMRFTDDEIERAGIERSVSVLKDADMVVVLLDGITGIEPEDAKVLEATEGMTRIIAVNKIDKGTVTEIGHDCAMSVKSGEGVENFIKLCSEYVSMSDSEKYSKAVMVTARQMEHFNRIIESVERLSKYKEVEFDIFEYELNSSLRLLSEITGLSYTEDILSNIFNNFCIGK